MTESAQETAIYYLDLLDEMVHNSHYKDSNEYLKQAYTAIKERGFITKEEKETIDNIWESIYNYE